MKKIFALILAVAMMLSTFALVGCGEKEETPEPVEVDALEALQTVWNSYEDDNRFAVMGGDAANAVMDAPGEFDLADTAAVNDKIGIPEDKVSTVDKAATLIHMMNANTFSAAAVHVAEGNTVEDVSKIIGDNLKTRQWMCGIPEKHVILKVGDNTIVSAFGALDLMTVFLEKVNAAYPDNTVLLEQTFE